MLTCAGRVTANAMQSAMSSAVSGCVDAGVDPVGGGLVAAVAHERELLGAHHAGRDLGDPHRPPVQLEPQRLDQRGRAVLGRRVPAAALVDEVPGDRTGDDDVAARAALDSAGSSACVTRSTPSTLVSYIACQSAGSARSIGSVPIAPPALLTSTATSSSDGGERGDRVGGR